jgi:hypothetical protein
MEAILTEKNLADEKYSVLVDATPGYSTLLVSFGGIANKLPIPVFEFMRALDPFQINKIFIRDFKQCWYTNGIEGISKNPFETIEYLRKLISTYGSKRCVFLGNSAGGYAALLYGQLLEVHETHAFSPQTFIDKWHRLMYWDRRWKKEISKLNNASSDLFDIRKVFRENYTPATKHNIYWDARHRLDNIHAKRVDSENVKHFRYQIGGHAIIKKLRDNGELYAILERSTNYKST